MGLYPLQMSNWSLKEYEEGVVTVFNCLPMSESSKLQGIVSHTVSLLQPRLNAIGQSKQNKTKRHEYGEDICLED